MRIGPKKKRITAGTRKRSRGAEGLMMNSLLDILVTILFFLLKNYSYVITNFAVSHDLTLPDSTAYNPPPGSTLQLVVSKKAIILDDKELATLDEYGNIRASDLHSDGVTVVPLFRALEAHKQRSKFFEKQNEDHTFKGTVVLQADKSLKFRTIKKVIYTAGVTDFINLRLAVIKHDA